MKKIAYALCLLTSITCASARSVSADEVDGYIYRSSALSISTTTLFDVGELDRFSMHVVYSSHSNTAATFTEGTKSVATITVGSNFALLQDATAYATIKVSSNSASALEGAYIQIAGKQFRNGTEWTRQSTATGTAKNIETALNLYDIIVATASYGGTSSDTVRSSATIYGTYANSYAIFTSTPAALSVNGSTYTATSTYTGGKDRGFIDINGTTLYSGLDFTVGASTAATATNIAAAINANSTLSTIVVATAPLTCTIGSCGVVKSTSTVPGVNGYTLTTSSYPILTPSGSRYTGGVASDINSTTNIITKTNVLALGMGAFIGSTAPTGLTANATYYAIPVVLGSSFKLSDTSTGAVAGVTLDISTTAAGGGSYTLTPSSTTTGASFVFQQSNDGTNWVTAVTTGTLSTITIGPPSGVSSAFYDFGEFSAKYLRFNFTAPTRGGIVTDIAIHGKR